MVTDRDRNVRWTVMIYWRSLSGMIKVIYRHGLGGESEASSGRLVDKAFMRNPHSRKRYSGLTHKTTLFKHAERAGLLLEGRGRVERDGKGWVKRPNSIIGRRCRHNRLSKEY
jgi:hypothetical protein